MNRLVLIGNGFDLAHGLKTSYKDFIQWYWEERIFKLKTEYSGESSDELCTIKLTTKDMDIKSWHTYIFSTGHTNTPNSELYMFLKENRNICEFSYTSLFFKNINHEVETKNWVDIENEYYKLLVRYAKEEITENAKRENIEGLNKELRFLQEKLVVYLRTQEQQDINYLPIVANVICDPFRAEEIATNDYGKYQEYVVANIEKAYKEKTATKDLTKGDLEFDIHNIQNDAETRHILKRRYVDDKYREPEQTMLLSFNYTRFAYKYKEAFRKQNIEFNFIHGDLGNPTKIIFGYGDDLDENYKLLENLNDNSILLNIKSHHYLESSNYKKLLEFAEADAFQICIFGHSCGNSDRTLLNTLFEHKNCVSIKPYYYEWTENGIRKDNYMDLIINISRNFNDKKLLRERVVSKEKIYKY